MMLNYAVEPADNGWNVVEHGDVLASVTDRDEAVRLAEFFARVALVSGDQAKLTVDGQPRVID